MYNKITQDLILNIYKELPNYNINGKKRKTFINNVFKGHINTIYNWLKNVNVINVKNNNYEYKNKKITKTIELFVIEMITNNPTINSKTIKIKIFEIFKIKLSKSSIYSILKHNNFTYKTTKIITNPYTITEQKEQLKNKKEVIKQLNVDNIISIDETSIVLSSKSSRGWSLKGTKCIVANSGKKIINKRFSLIMAVSNKKIIDFHIVNKAASSKDYLKFMMKLKRKDKENNKSYLMDNCQIHKSKELRKYYKDEKMHVLYNVPYHSETNPIENVFSCLKNKINRSVNDSYENIIKILKDFRTSFNPEKLTNIFNHSFGLYDQFN